MTSTSVVGGMATLGMPEAGPDCDCATDATGSSAMRKGIIDFIGVSSRFGSDSYHIKSTFVLFKDKKKLIFSEALYKKFLASINICSRFWGDKVIRAAVNTPAMLGNNS